MSHLRSRASRTAGSESVPSSCCDLEREPGRRHAAVGDHFERAVGDLAQDLPLDPGGQTRFPAEGEHCAGLDAARAGAPCRAHSLRAAVRAGEPERKADRGDRGEVDRVALAVFGVGLGPPRPARRRVVPAGGRAFDDEPVRARGGLPGEALREVDRGDDREKPRAPQRRARRHARKLRGVEPGRVLGSGRGAQHLHGQDALRMARERVEQARQLVRASGSRDDEVDAREHCTVDRGGDRQPDLAQHVDADHAVMMVLGAHHLGECRHHGELVQLHEPRTLQVGSRLDGPLVRVLVGLPLPTGGVEVPGEQPRSDTLVGELLDPPARAPVAVLQQAGVHAVETRPGDHAEPSGHRHRPRQPVAGHVDAHPSLDHVRKRGRGAPGRELRRRRLRKCQWDS